MKKCPLNPKHQTLANKYRKELRKKATKAEKHFAKILEFNDIRFIFQKSWLKNGFYISDFYIPKYKCVIEIDGEYHDTPEQKLKDESKDRYCRSLGFRVLRITNSQALNDLELIKNVLQMIREAK